MTPPALPTDSKALAARKYGLHDALSGQSRQGDDAQAFEGILAQVDTGQPSAKATTGPVVQGQMTKAATAATIVPAAPGADDPSILSLVERSVVTTTPSGSRAKTDDEASKDDATSATGGAADPGISSGAALTAALAALQSGLQTPAPGGASPPAAGTSSKATSDAVNGLPATTTISDVKVESHLQVDAQQRTDTAAGSATATPETKDDASIVVVPAASTPVQAIANAVSTLAKAAAATAPVPSDTTAATVPAPPRTMTLQLTPASLGTVSVTMHLVGQSLDLQLGVSDKETLGAITRSRASLTEAMQDQGYDLRSLVIQGADASASSSTNDGRSAAGQDRGNPSQSGASGQGSASGNSGGGGGSGSGTNQRDTHSRRTWPDDTSRAPANAGTGALFV